MFECSNKKNETTKISNEQKLDTLKYEYDGFNNGLLMNLISDNRFYYEDYWYGCTGGGEKKIFHGKYTITDNTLTLKADSVTIESTPFDRHFNPEIKTYSKIDDSLKFKTKYHFLKWNNLSYLLSDENDSDIYVFDYNNENDFQKFVNYYNSGYEPESHGRYLHRTLDSIKLNEKIDKNQLPLKWRNRLFDDEIIVKVIGVKKITKVISDEKHEFFKIKINKGKSSNLYRGLKLSDEYDNIWLVLDSIAENSSFGELYNDIKIKSGVELRTKWDKNVR